VTHWTQVLSNVSLVEFVLLAALTTVQWVRHRIRGAGWVALSFAVLGGLALALKIEPGLVANQYAAKSAIALLLVVPYCLFRFVATFRTPIPALRAAAIVVTVPVMLFTFALKYLPAPGFAAPPSFLAYRVSFLVASGFLLGYVVVSLFLAGRGEPPIAAARMHLLAIAVVGLEIPVVLAALRVQGPSVDLAMQSLAVVLGVLFLVALVLPSFVRVFLSRHEDAAFRRAVSELVSAGDSRDVAEHLLPHVCALVGASWAALLAGDGTVVARYPVWTEDDGPDPEAADNSKSGQRRITVETRSGATHSLAVKISPSMPYFGSEELHKLDQLAGMAGLAIERCEMAEQIAFQASHDGLTGLANRSMFMERLEEAMTHVGRRRAALAVLFIDLDRFKLVNDRADHSVGDRVLSEMANRLTAMTRGVDLVARFGGDEFVAFAEVDHQEDALEMAERIRTGLGTPVDIGNGNLVVVTASVGVVMTADESTSPLALLREADNAMYEAKRSGRDQVVLFHHHARDLANRKWGLTPTRTRRLSAG
jgi:diguanylate cyclase (GGDEF)-like protein